MPNTVNNIKYSAAVEATPARGFGILASTDATTDETFFINILN